MKSSLSASTIKILLFLARHPHARILLVDDASFLLDAQCREHKVIIDKVFATMRGKWLTVPQECGHQLAECGLTERGKEIAESIEASKNQFQQLSFDLDLDFMGEQVDEGVAQLSLIDANN